MYAGVKIVIIVGLNNRLQTIYRFLKKDEKILDKCGGGAVY